MTVDLFQGFSLVIYCPLDTRRLPPAHDGGNTPSPRVEAKHRARLELANVPEQGSRRLDGAVEVVIEYRDLVALARAELHQRLERGGKREHLVRIDVVDLLDADAVARQQQVATMPIVVAKAEHRLRAMKEANALAVQPLEQHLGVG